MKLKLYLVKQKNEVSYDCYDAFVISCKSEEDAINYNPGGDEWNFNDIEVTFLGNATKGVKEGIVLDSFRAG
ncbi:MAG: hypothetical protein WC707_07085 [Candidatus Babeliaceae bacterium]|jgi:hypothetical protein